MVNIDSVNTIPALSLLIGQRPRAFASARPIQQWRKTWPGTYEALFARFCASKGQTKGIKDFIQVLLLHKKYNAQDIQAAIERALKANVSCSNAVFQILMNSLEQPTSFSSLPNWEILPTPDVSVYSQIGGAV